MRQFLILLLFSPVVSYGQDAPISEVSGLIESCKQYVNVSYGQQVYPVHATEDPTAAAIGAGACMGYLTGFSSAASLIKESKSPVTFCKPPEVTVDEMAKVLIQFSDAHPQLSHMNALPFVIATFSKAYPCP